MNNKIITTIILILLLFSAIFVAADQYTQHTYDLTLLQYMRYSSPLTEEERAYLEDKRVISFVSDKNAPPFAYIDSGSGQYKGLVLDYASALSIELGVEIRFIPEEWDEAISSLANGEADVCDMFASEERNKSFLFSDSIYRLTGIVLTRKGDESILGIIDLSGKKIGIPAGDYAIEYIKSHVSDVDIVETTDILSSIDALLKGNVDAVAGDEPVIFHFANMLSINERVNIIHPPLYEKDVSLAIRKSEGKLLQILNKGIFNLKRKDVVQKIQQKWFGLSVPILKDRIPKKVLISTMMIMISLFLVFILTFAWSNTLKREVKERTRDLNQSRHDLQMSFDALSDYLVVIGEKDIIVNANKSFCQWVKQERKDVVGRNYKDFGFLKFICEKYNLGNQRHEDIEREEINFGGRHFSISITQLEQENKKVFVAADDITDLKISQKQLVQQNKMIAVGQLAAGVAHEIRNPLGIIRNYSYVLKNRINRQDPIIEKAINAIEASVLRAGKIVENLLGFSRASDDSWQEIELRQSILDIVSLEGKLLSEKNIDIKLNCDKHIKVYKRLESMNHITLNLISNSVAAMPQGGTITIDCTISEDCLNIDFADTGSGIDPNNLEYIFNPFFTTKSASEGTGLGLYIVYNEVHKMGGDIQVESQAGQGTIFRLKFPLKEARNNG